MRTELTPIIDGSDPGSPPRIRFLPESHTDFLFTARLDGRAILAALAALIILAGVALLAIQTFRRRRRRDRRD